MQVNVHITIIVLLGVLFFMTGVLVLYWCVKSGQLRNFDQGARSVFTDEEPEGMQSDFFPGKEEALNNKFDK